ncbi:MAG: hypothetical protein AB8B50_21155 [Pirellulaceae bacterium]
MAKNSLNAVSCLIFASLGATLGCHNEGGSAHEHVSSPSFVREQLEAIHSGHGLTGRTYFSSNYGKIVLLHHPLQDVEAPDLDQLLGRNTPALADDGMIVKDSTDLWVEAAEDCATSFNCCTYAVGEDLGLSPFDWVQPIATASTLMINPMQTILDSYYKIVIEHRLHSSKISEVCNSIADTDDLIDDDVVCFTREAESSVRFLHAGRVKKKGSRNWLISKMGAGPIVLTTIELAAEHYGLDTSDSLQVYRFSGSKKRM